MFEERLHQLARLQRRRHVHTIRSRIGPVVELNGRRAIVLASNDYLGLSTHPNVIKAAIAAMREYGVGAGASRLITGTMPPHTALETELARFKQTESALTFAAGYLANIGMIPSLIGPDGLICADRLCHASLIEACRLSRATLKIFHHADAEHLEKILKQRRAGQSALIVTDGLFSMDGDVAPLSTIADVAERYDAMTFVDDAHGTGVMGPTGRGSLEHCGVQTRIPFHMGTLSKAIGCAGGYVVGPDSLIQFLLNTSRSFMYTTAAPPAIAAGARAALLTIMSEPDRRTRLWRNRDYLFRGLQRLGFRMSPTVSPIMPILIGDAESALRFSASLLDHGVYAPAIRPPTVPRSTSRIRVTVTAEHTIEHLEVALTAFERAGRFVRLI